MDKSPWTGLKSPSYKDHFPNLRTLLVVGSRLSSTQCYLFSHFCIQSRLDSKEKNLKIVLKNPNLDMKTYLGKINVSILSESGIFY